MSWGWGSGGGVGGGVSMVDCPTSEQQKQACWEASEAQLLIKNCMQWKQLAQAGRRNALLSEGDPVRPAEGKS